MGADKQQPKVLRVAPAPPPDGAHQNLPESPWWLHAEGIPGSIVQARHEAASCCKVRPQVLRAGPEDTMGAEEHQLLVIRAAPAVQPDW